MVLFLLEVALKGPPILIPGMLLQNADDAGATTIKFCLDERHHKTGTLSSC